jgi:hypothetical protein
VSEGRTGALVSALAEGVRSDLGDIAADLEAVRQRVEKLGESARAVNGLGGECNGWSSHLNSLIEQVKKEAIEVPAKLLGTAINQIVTSVDPDLAEKVSRARRSA